MGVPPAAGEREVYEFFSREAGKVRDIQIIRDTRTGKSKGVAYVEFYLQDAVMKALACNGRPIMGYPIRVQASGAEKNRAAEAEKAVQIQLQEKPIMLYISGLNGILSHMDDSDLRKMFEAFGAVEFCRMGRCPYTNKSRGFAHLQFSRAADAREAMSCLNEFEICHEKILVGYLTRSLDGDVENEVTVRSAEDRIQVMEALMSSK
jgi:RNA-binding protein 39